MGEIIFKRHAGYTNIPNAILRDPRLSLKTKGLFAVMFSLPEDWDYNIKGLAHINGVGRDAIRSALAEMESAGYLTRQQAHGDGGKFGSNIYEVRDESTIPLSENPTTVEPTTAKPLPVQPLPEKPTQYNKDLSTKEQDPPIAPRGGVCSVQSDELFARFWAAYPRKVNKTRAKRAWDKLKPDLALCRAMAEALEKFKASDQWQRDGGLYIPHPASWLNNRRWEDEDIITAHAHNGKGGGTGIVDEEDLPVW